MQQPLKLRIVTYILALIFFASGMAKLFALPFEIAAFERWGYSMTFMYLVGVIEVAGALGLLVSRFSAIVSLALAAFMMGAIATHLIHQEWPMLAFATAVALGAAWRGWVSLKTKRGRS
ncbi:DoxX family protein [Thalassotalea litorea]|uniref:DoxX family protein n=1 Tax=Thalassotalea litorea TaxID=2020715 RepID=UPI00373556F1